MFICILLQRESAMTTFVDKLKHIYRKGHMNAFHTASSSIDSQYVDGISITMG